MPLSPFNSNPGQQPVYQVGLTEILLLLFALGLFITTKIYHVDFTLADAIYTRFKWHYQKAFITEQLLHRYSRFLVILIYLGLLYKLATRFLAGNDPKGVYHLFILLLAIALSVIIVAVLKQFFEVDCPWDLLRYGGSKPYFSLFNYDPKHMPSAHCFPASHAGVGFSWMALFFYCKVTAKPLSSKIRPFMVLVLVILVGVVFGVAQQFRGAHFISHDVASFIVCLITTICVYSLAYRQKKSA
ncbi:MAG: phosphatase PAP2 family protein [Proteobacteria bacterium]|nr:MAG: phosphatase PAP2 family protein [Pseudomonadota bacterium]